MLYEAIVTLLTCMVDGGRRSSSQLQAMWIAASLIGLGRVDPEGPSKPGVGPGLPSASCPARLPLALLIDGGSAVPTASDSGSESDSDDSLGTAHAAPPLEWRGAVASGSG